MMRIGTKMAITAIAAGVLLTGCSKKEEMMTNTSDSTTISDNMATTDTMNATDNMAAPMPGDMRGNGDTRDAHANGPPLGNGDTRNMRGNGDTRGTTPTPPPDQH